MTCWEQLLETDWGRELESEFGNPYWDRLHTLIEDKRTLPPSDDVFAALLLTSYADTRVVILGQDPYPGAGRAHGLAFSVPCGVPVPDTLKNIYKELHADQRVPVPNHGNLEDWARRGVLLLNATLTVGDGVSHRGEWEKFTEAIVRVVDKKPFVVFILWGVDAQGVVPLLDACRHEIIASPHPARRAARKGFFGSRPFCRANSALRAAGGIPIDWEISDCPEPNDG